MKNDKLQEKLFLKKESAWKSLNHEEVFSFCEEYKDFLKKSKNERLCVKNIISLLEKNGFKNFDK